MLTFDDVYYPGQIFRPEFNAAVKPALDCCEFLRRRGAHRLGLPTGTRKSINWAHVVDAASATLSNLTMPRDKVVVLQFPYQSRIAAVFKAAKRRGNKVALMVHDINELRGYTNKHFHLLGEADVLFVHTPRMKEWVEKQFPGFKCVVPGIFDYLCDFSPASGPVKENDGKRHIVFAGNLFKSEFLGKISGVPDWLEYDIYGKKLPSDLRLPEGVVHKGAVPPEQLPYEICGADFGLVWDGPSADCCAGEYGDYLQYNAPYKASSYIASGLPVILWDRMGLADFVLREGIGIAVSSLDEIPARLEKMSAEEYAAMKERVLKMQKKIIEGGFFMDAVGKALDILNETKNEGK